MTGHPLVITVLPDFTAELQRLLLEEGEAALAASVASLRFHEWCACGDDFCQGFYTEPKPSGAYGPGHRMVCLLGEGDNAMINLDLIDNDIMYVEVLARPSLLVQFRGP